MLLMERLPRWAPSPRTFWIETSARKISFVRARCGNAGKDGGAERARQVVGDGKHLPTGYQPPSSEPRSLSLTGKQANTAAAAGALPAAAAPVPLETPSGLGPRVSRNGRAQANHHGSREARGGFLGVEEVDLE
jgi:hypothetical protein